MTVGAKTRDRTYYYSVPGGRQARIGWYDWKSWSGSDTPSTQKVRVTRKAWKYRYPLYGPWKYDPAKRKRGREVVRDGHWYLADELVPLPKRAWHTEPHAYTVIGISGTITKLVSNSLANQTGTQFPHNLHNQPTLDFYADWTSNDDIALLGKLREAIAGSDFNAGVALAESGKALKMIQDSANRIYRGYRAARKGNLRAAARELLEGTPRARFLKTQKRVASDWLQLQYGWLPLLKDAQGAAQFLAQHYQYPLQKRFTAIRNAGGIKPFSRNRGQWVQNSDTLYRDVRNCCSKRIVAYIKEKDVVALSGLLDPASVQWELTPFSFVLDWFVPIGNYLQARGLSQSVTGTFVTTFKEVTTFERPWTTGWPYSSWPYVGPSNGFGTKWTRYRYTRTISTTLSVPKPQFKPLMEVPSWKRAANAVALVIQMKR